ncbi:hypothetical protein LIPSTDRAFT_67387 [Lipomyces starkeyi NRRL Y-11557]|uniref:Uncharacterized protein n=1 Tax=Lipomyces starkeyi NRRL Y-11557 TaxID=675824 RepID=A0A1E3PTE5_LIPST|nr:hypothetical protein LIPSTDRAFT_76827 [Lipomyces starkeyi NRRL Y-11557]ODQ74408.1 hypothetical protein LIPSTDRAFT_70033 [Lipomyces starkeyi NRRL Y-11557]ODQ76474.1 hypothetical protein LIPSTDRAFT_67387 [Lipomyces starkeyi NRRL Y-11557]
MALVGPIKVEVSASCLALPHTIGSAFGTTFKRFSVNAGECHLKFSKRVTASP